MSSVLQSRRSLYVGGLAEDVGEATLRAAMIPFGPVKSIDMVRSII
jgi:RNA recognition motif-containing protein